MPVAVQTKILTGANSLPDSTQLGQLCIDSYREWPHLYEGTFLDFEKDYLKHYAVCIGCLLAETRRCETPRDQSHIWLERSRTISRVDSFA